MLWIIAVEVCIGVINCCDDTVSWGGSGSGSGSGEFMQVFWLAVGFAQKLFVGKRNSWHCSERIFIYCDGGWKVCIVHFK